MSDEIYTDDTNSIAIKASDMIDQEFQKLGRKLTIRESERIFECLFDCLEEFSNGQYRSGN